MAERSSRQINQLKLPRRGRVIRPQSGIGHCDPDGVQRNRGDVAAELWNMQMISA
jgi:hypothetical protein